MRQENLHERITLLARLLIEQRCNLALAESCTGGLIAASLTEIAGCSAWFDRGFVAYSNAAKAEQLGVNLKTLNRYGAVSSAAVTEMVEGVLSRSTANLALAVSGVAGPGGGSVEKPVGTVWMACAGHSTRMPSPGVETYSYQFDGDRKRIREQSLAAAVEVLVERCAY